MTPTPTVEAPPLAPNWLENIRGLANGLMAERSYVAPGCVLEQRGREIDHLLRSYQALTAPSPATGGVETVRAAAFKAGWNAHETGYSASPDGRQEALAAWLKGTLDLSDPEEEAES